MLLMNEKKKYFSVMLNGDEREESVKMIGFGGVHLSKERRVIPVGE